MDTQGTRARPGRRWTGALGSGGDPRRPIALPFMASRVLVTEPLAQVGLDTPDRRRLRRRRGRRPRPRRSCSAPSGALRRSSSAAPPRSTAEVLEAGTDLVVVGRAGIGLDNVDVATATRKGVMVVNAPQSNILSAAEHAVALLISQARNVPQADADLKAGNWRRSKWEGVELHGKTLGIVGLGRIGGLVAQRALAFGMHLIAYDPYVSAERARQMGVDLLPTVEEVAAQSDFLTIHLPRTPETKGLIGRDLLAQAKPGIRIVNAARGGIVDEEALYDAIVSGRVQGAAIDVFAEEPTTKSPLFELESVVVTPHLGRLDGRGAGQGGPHDRRAGRAGPAGRLRALRRQRRRRGGVRDRAALPAAGRAARPPVQRAGGRRGRDPGAVVRGPGGRLRLPHPRPVSPQGHVLAGVGRAGQLRQRPADGRGAGAGGAGDKTSSSLDYVNLISLRGRLGDRMVHVAGTLAGKSEQPRIVGIDDHIVDVPPSRNMLVVRNDDRPGMIGVVGLTLGRAGVNIADMTLGRGPTGEHALMVLATDSPVTAEVVEDLRANAGILDAKAIVLD